MESNITTNNNFKKQNLKKFIQNINKTIRTEKSKINAWNKEVIQYEAIIDILSKVEGREKISPYREKINKNYNKIDNSLENIESCKKIINVLKRTERTLKRGEQSA